MHGGDALSAVTLTGSGAPGGQAVPAAGLFVMVGAAPNTGWLQGLVALDAKGFIVTEEGFATATRGVLAVGDVRAASVKRVASAVGEGSIVISQVWAHMASS